MSISTVSRRPRFVAALALLACLTAPAVAADLTVATSGGFAAASELLKPQYEKASGNMLAVAWGPSMGDTPNTIPNRLKRGESIDVVVMVDSALDGLIKDGKVTASSKVVLARSIVGMAVKAGAPRPDISTVDALKRTLLNAKSIAYSDNASGLYLETNLFPRLGIWEQIKGKSHKIPAEPVAKVVARGEAEIGFQQLAELMPESGVDVVGPLPTGAQQITLYSAGVVTTSTQPEAAKALVEYLHSDAALASINRTGLDPISASK